MVWFMVSKRIKTWKNTQADSPYPEPYLNRVQGALPVLQEGFIVVFKSASHAI